MFEFPSIFNKEYPPQLGQHSDTNKNAKAASRCYVLCSYEGTIFNIVMYRVATRALSSTLLCTV